MARMRIRSVHPELWTDRRFVGCSDAARLFWLGLHNAADDGGIFEWEPLALKMRLRPGDTDDAGALLAELEAADLVRAFDGPEGRLGVVRAFHDTQSPQRPTLRWELPAELRAFAGLPAVEAESLTAVRRRLVERQGRQCAYCATEITHHTRRALTCEVVADIPASRGGAEEEGNLAAACRSCAAAKGERTGEEFMAFLMGRLAGRRRERPALRVVAGAAVAEAPAESAIPGIASAIPGIAPANPGIALEGKGEERSLPPPSPPGGEPPPPSDPFPRYARSTERPPRWEAEFLTPGPRGPECGGWEWPVAQALVREALAWPERGARIDWQPLARWLHGGLDLHDDVLPLLRRTAGRLEERGEIVRSLGLFERDMSLLLARRQAREARR